ncbi:hypothetical protein LCGC14_1747770 [marine sediment metagenome]|uniref:Uncharacterized protein n=1 Tax=marine sediment metagenome TaxID=412755 RepID=A0A0F9K478_9ZZZZ
MKYTFQIIEVITNTYERSCVVEVDGQDSADDAMDWLEEYMSDVGCLAHLDSDETESLIITSQTPEKVDGESHTEFHLIS